MNTKLHGMTVLAGLCLTAGSMALGSSPSLARTVRFTDLTAGEARSLQAGDGDLVVEFVKGDQIPLHPSIAGNLLATVGTQTVLVTAQSTFFIKRDGSDVLISADGAQFAPIGDKVHGQLSANANGDSADGGRVEAISISLLANLVSEK